MAAASALFAIGASLAAMNVAFVAIVVAVGWTMRLRPVTITLHQGPSITAFSWRGMAFFLRLLPLGSGVRFLERAHVSPACAQQVKGRIVFADELHPLCRILFALSPPCGFLAFAWIVLGDNLYLDAITALPQIYLGALRPNSLGVELLSHYVTKWQESPLIALALLSAKYGVYLLVPTPGSPGFHAIVETVRAVSGRNPLESLKDLPLLLLSSPAFVAYIGWTVALAVYGYQLLDTAI
ncbi:hypothetical protein [Lacipirellula parvula]|uniref:Uncharacterized protein n=1 Tax=Lacipirellula parvula TaxID=2650471 RepID=A0A5K7X424_9BACT|nr:hypothetical protein [Lacipirellula parvula]BBO30557.1 hypothetical protein PLANPX_0169 [Lacipirellula parvula]